MVSASRAPACSAFRSAGSEAAKAHLLLRPLDIGGRADRFGGQQAEHVAQRAGADAAA